MDIRKSDRIEKKKRFHSVVLNKQQVSSSKIPFGDVNVKKMKQESASKIIKNVF